jgi:hypothetical protein
LNSAAAKRSTRASSGGVAGLKALAELVEELEEFVGIAAGREELAGGHAMHEAVAAGYGFAFGGAGSGAFLSIFAVGVDLRGGGHEWVLVRPGALWQG